MNELTFSDRAWDEYLDWQLLDKKTLKRVNQLFKDVKRNNFEGIGKPEPLKNRDGWWSRRIDDQNRLVYIVSGDNDIYIVSCRGHYEK